MGYKNIEDRRRNQRENYRRKKLWVFEQLGFSCSECGSINNLTIEHKNGYAEKYCKNGTRGGRQNLQHAINLIKNGKKDELEILCFNCNLKKREMKEGRFVSTYYIKNGIEKGMIT